MDRIYEKLVRDNIPSIIQAQNEIPVIRVLEEDEYLRLLDDKMQEEMREYFEDGSMEELADLIEVIRAAIIARGHTWDEVEEIRKAKAEKNGAFEKRIYLKGVEKKH